MLKEQPILYLFPVGLSDAPLSQVLPEYNIELIRSVKHFIVENVRTARRFLKACDRNINIDELTFSELNRHTDPKDVANMLEPMSQGHSMGIISEAGCPAIADPGADVVAIAQRKGYAVMPLIGPSSILLSLMGSGFNGQSFAFLGYLPIDAAQRTSKLKEMEKRVRKEKQTQIFIETPYRNNKLIQWLCSNLAPDMLLCVASNITGEAQSIVTLPISKWKTQKYDYDKQPSIFLIYN